MKVGIVVPFSWSFCGGVAEHAENQALALAALGIDARILIGYDPPDRLTRLLHPPTRREGGLPAHALALGRSIGVPANGSRANVSLSPRVAWRLRRTLRTERFDVLHVHEPAAPLASAGAVALADAPLVGTFHAAGDTRWLQVARPLLGGLLRRLDHRIAVSRHACQTAASYFPGTYEVIPNGVWVQPDVRFEQRRNRVVFTGRADARKGLAIALRAWPAIARATGARLRVIGADPAAVRRLMERHRIPADGIDLLGVVSDTALTAELRAARLLLAPSLRGESFGMVLTRAFACGTPVVASDIAGYREVVAPACGRLVPPGDPQALARATCELLADDEARAALGAGAWQRASEEYSWDVIAQRLAGVYARLLRGERTGARPLPERAPQPLAPALEGTGT